MMLLEEIASIFITACLLIFVLPERVEEILRFITDFTVDIEGVGHVCSLSAFDFERHGNRKYGSPFEAMREKSSQGKMEKSFLSFVTNYPTWEPNPHGQQFLATLCNFGEQQIFEDLQNYLPTNRWQAGTRYPVRDIHRNRDFLMTGFDVESFWSVNPGQRPHPYLLDWYYTSQSENPVEIVTDSPPLCSKLAFEQTPDLCPQQNRQQGEIKDQEDWGSSHLSDRMQSHFEASTSATLLRDGYHEHLNPGNYINHWWARPGTQSSGPETSFIEPPAFGCNNFIHHSDNQYRSGMSDRSMDDHDQERGYDDYRNWNCLPVFGCNNFIHRNDGDYSSNMLDTSVDDQERGCSDYGNWKDPPAFRCNNLTRRSDSHHSHSMSGRSVDDQEQGNGMSDKTVDDQERSYGDYRSRRGSHMLSRTMYVDDSDRDDGIDLHFAEGTGKDQGSSHATSNVFGNPLRNLPVRILPTSSDPVE